ncbi:hypothetical protein A9Q81_05590 [Gammaproteobacteria bacterium 42_54_T18]|nr:hypothetical protein A9Q81_05590 [Gammaproteobacteria bacterium 42_54_T18]
MTVPSIIFFIINKALRWVVNIAVQGFILKKKFIFCEFLCQNLVQGVFVDISDLELGRSGDILMTHGLMCRDVVYETLCLVRSLSTIETTNIGKSYK